MTRPTYRSNDPADLWPTAQRWSAEKRAGIGYWVVARENSVPGWEWTILPEYKVHPANVAPLHLSESRDVPREP